MRRKALEITNRISTHAPAGGATTGVKQECKFLKFLLTPLREGRPVRQLPARPVLRHFYSRPCGRGDDYWKADFLYEMISTHAPAGGATRRRY